MLLSKVSFHPYICMIDLKKWLKERNLEVAPSSCGDTFFSRDLGCCLAQTESGSTKNVDMRVYCLSSRTRLNTQSELR